MSDTRFARYEEPNASADRREDELEEQILRLQYLVSRLVEKNEGLRQQLAGRAGGDGVTHRLNANGVNLAF